jgi:Tol biopolymer transport system component/predicted Ser/Thr protein kinase
MIGRTLDHYQLECELGRGGMGVVYEARDLRLGRSVAIKVLPPGRVADPGRKQRFVQEARAASALNHPNIVSIYDIRSEDGLDFIVMERVAGRTLDEAAGPKGLSSTEALRYASQIAGALAQAHNAGILHRDLKPSNIMVTADGRVKILDFGLAKLLDQENPGPDASTVTAGWVTEEGAVVGTAPYMSPEQAEGRALDARSDIFSFGCVLYEMVTGRRPFSGGSRLDILSKVVREEPALPRQIRSSIPLEIEKLILRCLRKDPARRFQSMADLKIALDDLRDEIGAGGTPARRRPLRPWVWAAAAAAVIAIAFLAWWSWSAGQPAEPPRATALTTFPGLELHPSFSPDGNHVAFSWSGRAQENTDIYVQQIGAGSPLRLTTDPLNDYNPVWSPDGRWIAFFRGAPPAPIGLRKREIRIIPPLGGADRKIAEVLSQDFFPLASYLAWSADSGFLIVTDTQGVGRPDALFSVSVETGEKAALTRPQLPVLADLSPAVSSDGSRLVFLRRTTWGAGELHLLPLRPDLTAAAESKRLTHAEFGANFPVWIPGSRDILFSAKRALWRMTAAENSSPGRLAFAGEDALMPAVSRPGQGRGARLAYVRSFADFNFWRLNTPGPGAPATSAPVLAAASTRVEYHIQFSPDGRRVAFTSERSGEPEIWVSDPDGSNAVQLTFLRGIDANCPAWSPDGETVAFSAAGKDEFDIYTVPAAGGKLRRLTTDPAIDLCPSFSQDGKWIYFSSMRAGDSRLRKMPASGGEAVEVAAGHAGRAMEASNGDVYYITTSILSPLFRLPAAGGGPVKVAESVVWFNFSVLGKGVYYVGQVGNEVRLQYFDSVTGRTTTIARNLGDAGAGLTVSPDGKTILYTRMDASADDLMLVENFR